MKEIGIIKEVKGKRASVIIQRSAACGDCGACQVGKEKMTMEANAYNTIGAKEGDKVEVEMEFVNVLKASFILYGIPLVLFIIGILMGEYLPILPIDKALNGFVIGSVLMLLSFVIIKYLDQKGVFSLKYEPQITHIIN